jgi:patatin-like phospholipase/acyl hydrolase
MLSFSDQSYQQTKRIKQGKAKMPPGFRPLAQWIDRKYGVKTINIIHDTINDGEIPRLQICFEFEWEEMKFLNGNKSMDIRKQQAIAQEFARMADEARLPYRTKNIWVIYGAFEPIAKAEAVSKIPQEKIKQLQEELNDQNLWLIMATSLGVKPGFFLFTDEQVKAYTGSEVINSWTDLFYALLKQYDEFGYINRRDFSIYLDSKENFDANYQSNWYYYFK